MKLIRNIYSRIDTIFQLIKFIIQNLDFLKIFLLIALLFASILFIFFKLFEFMAPFTYLAL